MANNGWEADKMLDVYIYDYLVKRNLETTAKAFMAEGNVAPGPVEIDEPGGFLFEWWSIFWDIFIVRKIEKHSEVAAAYVESQKIKSKEQQQKLQMQLFIQQRQAQRINTNYPSLSGPVSGMNSDRILGSSAPSVLTVKWHDECLNHSNSIDSEAYTQFIDPNRMALLNSSISHLGQVVRGNPDASPAAAIQDIKCEGNLAVVQRSLQMDPSFFSLEGIIPSKFGIRAPGLNQGVSGLPLKGWPLTLQYQAQAQGNLNFGDIDPRKFNGLSRGCSNGKDGQPTVNNGSVGSSLQASLPKVRSDQETQLVKNSRKRKQPTSPGALNITGTGNMMCPSISASSTPSTHTTCGFPVDGNMQHVNIMPKGLMMYGTDAAGGLRASSDHKEDLKHFEDVGSLDNHFKSFLSNHDGDARGTIAASNQSFTEHNPDPSKGFTFNEVAHIKTSNSIVICCHFSSNGKLLASAGHDKKVLLWNMETLQTEITPEEHTHIITDLRFRPGSMHLATSSFDRTVRLWNAVDPSYCLNTFNGHSSEVMSLDFHPKKTDLLCSCDGKGEIRFWNVNQYSCSHVSKGATAQVRFQPGIGQLLAAAAENIVTLFDVETGRNTRTLQGHTKEIHCVCWDTKGELLTSVSQDCVKVWSIASGECIHELSSNGNKFHSCVFHPSYANLLVIGGYQSLELWNMVESRRMTVQAHEELIPALAQSITGTVASASHDKVVKLWK